MTPIRKTEPEIRLPWGTEMDPVMEIEPAIEPEADLAMETEPEMEIAPVKELVPYINEEVCHPE